MTDPTPPDPTTPGTTPETPPQPSPEERDAVRAQQEAALRRFGWFVIAWGVVLVAGGAALGSLDFGVAVLIGFLVVLLNFYWTKKAVKSVLFAGQPRGLLTLSFLVKFGITGVVLFYAILRLNVDAVGVLVGLSSLALASALFALFPPGR